MTLYEIDSKMQELLDGSVDEETGELLVNYDELNALQEERDKKCEGVAVYIKGIVADIDALRAEEKKLAERRKRLERKRDGLMNWLEEALHGERLRDESRAVVNYRKSKKTEIKDEPAFIKWAKRKAKFLLKMREPDIDKVAVKKWLDEGNECKYAEVVETVSMNIK